MKEPQFSVIMPVCHGGSFLKGALESAAALDFPPDRYEIIVAKDDRHGEAEQLCADISRRAPAEIRLVAGNASTRSSLLNAACDSARGEWVAFTDDDCVLPSDWLQRFRDAINRNPDAGLIGGVDELVEGGSDFDEALDWVLNSRVGTGGYRMPFAERSETYHPKLWNMAAPRKLLIEMATCEKEDRPQVFDESIDVHEDVDLASRIRKGGRDVILARDVRVKHHRDTTFRSFVSRNFRMAGTCRRAGVHYGPHLALAAVAAAAACVAVAALFLRPWRLILAVLIAAYLLLLFISGIMAAVSRHRPVALILTPLLLAGVHVARTAGFLWPHPTPRREET